MFCPRCGTEAADTQKFCVKCGASFIDAPSASIHGAGAVAMARGIYASFGRRVCALIIDDIAFGAAYVASLTVLAGDRGHAASALAMALWLFGYWLYKAGMESSPLQGTLGKLAMDIKVTSLAGERISFLHATARHAAFLLDGMTCTIGFLMAAVTARRQALHDLIARTLVTRRAPAPAQIAAAPPAAGEGGILVALAAGFGGIVLVGILAAIAIPAYQDYTIRSQVMDGLGVATPYQAAISQQLGAGMTRRALNTPGLVVDAGRFSHYVDAVTVENGAVVIAFGNQANAALSGHRLMLYPVTSRSGSISWVCGNAEPPADTVAESGSDLLVAHTDLPKKYLPRNCQ